MMRGPADSLCLQLQLQGGCPQGVAAVRGLQLLGGCPHRVGVPERDSGAVPGGRVLVDRRHPHHLPPP